MAVAFDTVNAAGDVNSADAAQCTLDIANSPNRFAILTLIGSANSHSASSVTIGTQSFSFVQRIAYSTSYAHALYVCYNPDVGTQTARVVTQHSTSFGFAVCIFNGVDQTDGYSVQRTSSGSSAAVTATISTSTTDMVFAAFVTGGTNGDASLTCTGSTQRISGAINAQRLEHHTYAPAGTTQTVAFALVAGTFSLRYGINIKAVTTPPAGTTPTYTLPLTGVGQ